MATATLKPDRVFRALSDKTRLRILHLLLGGEVCVCDIVSALRCPQPTASRHLAYLRKVGLVSVRKEGIWCHYQLALADEKFAAALKQCIEACGDMPTMGKDAGRLRQCRARCCE